MRIPALESASAPDFHPADDRVVIASPCSGHGFKFSTVIGQIAADLVLERTTSFEIGFLSLERFAGARSGAPNS